MENYKCRIAVLSFIVAFIPFSAHAATHQYTYKRPAYKNMVDTRPAYLRDLEVEAGVGPTFYRVNKGHVQVSPLERDTSDPGNISENAVYRIGAGYYLFKNYFTPDGFFNSLLAELNLYHSNIVVKGKVYQYGQLNLYNDNFHAPFNSTALMLDFKPGFLAYENLSPYAILGLGVAWNQISYHETVISANVPANSFISLASRTKQDFAYDLGLGARYVINKHYSCSLEYIYSHLGNAQPNSASDNSASVTAIQIPPTFTLYNQSLFFNVIYNF